VEHSELNSLTTQYGKMEEDMGEGGREENKIITIKMLITMLCQNASLSLCITFYIHFCAAFPS